jgi:acyl carrier protein
VNTAFVVNTRVCAVIGEAFAVGEGELSPDTDLRDELGADSLAIVELLVRLERELGVDSDADMAELQTVGDIVRAFEQVEA